MSTFICPECKKTFFKNYFVWLFTTPFHWFKFKEMRDYRRTKCPHCGKKVWVKRIK